MSSNKLMAALKGSAMEKKKKTASIQLEGAIVNACHVDDYSTCLNSVLVLLLHQQVIQRYC